MLELCWTSHPNDRPTVEDVLQRLEMVQNSSEPLSPGMDEENEGYDYYHILSSYSPSSEDTSTASTSTERHLSGSGSYGTTRIPYTHVNSTQISPPSGTGIGSAGSQQTYYNISPPSNGRSIGSNYTSTGASPEPHERPAAWTPPPTGEVASENSGSGTIANKMHPARKSVSSANGPVPDTLDLLRKRSTKFSEHKVEEAPGSKRAFKSTKILEIIQINDCTTAISKWVRGELIGEDTCGKVYVALNTTGEMNAVKQVEIPRTEDDRSNSRRVTAVEALRLESEILKDLDHQNVIQYLGFEETPIVLSMSALISRYR